ncbi:nuclear polyadenylated RNA-binding protein 3 [Oncorhynchus tshawytscha]|nr:nuclear polyadenylated RNA-binding protein 3 [Oncorhynchus tshawytscha]
MNNVYDKTTSTRKVLIAFFLLVFLVCLLVFLYMWLNRKTNGQYTVRQLVYGQDGARDRIMAGVRVLEVRLGCRLWPLGADEEAIREEEHKNEERDVERGSEGRENEGEEEGEEREDRGDDSSDDYSSMEGCDLRERAKLTGEKEEIREREEEREENMEEKWESKEDGESDEGAVGGEKSGGGGLLIDLHQFSGSAIWSEDRSEGGRDKDDVTAL